MASIGSLDPLDGADLTLKIEHPELGGMLRKLEFPVVATGPADRRRLKDAGELTQLDFNAKVGEFTASTNGTLKALSLVGADLTLKIEHTEIGAVLEDARSFRSSPPGRCESTPESRMSESTGSSTSRRSLAIIDANVKGTLKTRSLVDPTSNSKPPPRMRRVSPSVFDVNGCARGAAQGLGTHGVFTQADQV